MDILSVRYEMIMARQLVLTMPKASMAVPRNTPVYTLLVFLRRYTARAR